MKKILVVLATLAIAVTVYAAGGMTVTFQTTTIGQDTYIQNTLIPEYNTTLCAGFNLASNCTGSQMVTAGCVAVTADTITKRSLVYRRCAPLTLDSTGESNLAADFFAKDLIAMVSNDKANSIVSACTNFKALSAGNQNTICTSLGAPVPATVCDICQ